MPRLTYRQLRQARIIHPFLPLLLRGCRDLGDAQNELRWLRESVQQRAPRTLQSQSTSYLRQLCKQRSKGKPLQYLLGNQPFGELEILCRPGVLIPRSVSTNHDSARWKSRDPYVWSTADSIRPETESYTTFLARCLHPSCSTRPRAEIRILDLCTGTGCISLLLHSLLAAHYTNLRIEGVDISDTALRLAHRNLQHNVKSDFLEKTAASQVTFRYDDILSKDAERIDQEWDVVVSNPPYISQSSFNKDTTRSTRKFEPRTALVPRCDLESDSQGTDLTGDVFYHKIVALARSVRAKLVVMEVADDEQAQRVVAWIDRTRWQPSIWHDNLYNSKAFDLFAPALGSALLHRVGTGKARAVVLASK